MQMQGADFARLLIRATKWRRVSPNSIYRSTGPTSAACWRAVKERPSIECVQAKAWHLLIERFGFPERGDCINARQRKKAKASRLEASIVPFSGLVQAHIRGESRSFCACSRGRHQ